MMELPGELGRIYQQVQDQGRVESNLETIRPAWEAHLERLREEAPEVKVSEGGEVVVLGELSPGCQACKDGTWDCIFLSNRCNLACPFCYSPQALPEEFAGSAFGSTPEEISANHMRTRITGISFSGGEPFLEPDKLLAWVAAFTSQFPEKYYWVYTNGLLAERAVLRRLGELGVQEIRFNTAATGYDHPQVLQAIELAAQYLPHITVEIPAIPGQAGKLLACLSLWADRGVRFLNLHELIYEPGTNAASLPGVRQILMTPDGHRTEYNPESRLLTRAVIKSVRESGLPLSVNDCSMQSKLRQVRGRRRSLAPLTIEKYERLVGDEYFETCAAYRDQEMVYLHPDELEERRARLAGWEWVRLRRLAPLEMTGKKEWVEFEWI